MAWTCLDVLSDAEFKSFTIYNIKTGYSYKIYHELRHEDDLQFDHHRQQRLKLEGNGKNEHIFHVVKLGQKTGDRIALPVIRPSSRVYEGEADTTSKVTTKSIVVGFNLEICSVFPRELLSPATQLLEICITLAKDDNRIAIIPLHCLPADQNSFSLVGLSVGTYQLSFKMRDKTTLQVFDDDSAHKGNDVHLEVQFPLEFIPSYEWQPLHEWHTIPSGIDTKIPLSGSATKEARIPSPWRLQISMPPPCKYFLRMDTFRGTLISEISESASRLCSLPPSCFTVMADGQPVDPSSSVEVSDFFNKRQSLSLIDHDQCNLGKKLTQ